MRSHHSCTFLAPLPPTRQKFTSFSVSRLHHRSTCSYLSSYLFLISNFQSPFSPELVTTNRFVHNIPYLPEKFSHSLGHNANVISDIKLSRPLEPAEFSSFVFTHV